MWMCIAFDISICICNADRFLKAELHKMKVSKSSFFKANIFNDRILESFSYVPFFSISLFLFFIYAK